jgi:predicted Zn finger-like uncharacterized protein
VSYRTTCPQCRSVFRLGPDQLDAAQGWVQCGVCGAAFDARASLLLEDGSPLPVVAEPEQSVEPATVEPLAAEPRPVAIDAGTQGPTPAPAQVEAPAPPAGTAEAPQIAEMPVGIAQREASLDLSSIIIIDPDIPVPDDFGEMPQIQATPTSGTSGMPPMYPPLYSRASPAAVNAAASAVGPAVSRAEPARPRPVPPQADDWTPPAPRGNRSWAWGIASVLLLGVLLAQTAYFLRDTLVSQAPQTRPLLERMCALLDCTLSLPKNLALLQIVGSDLETDARGRLTLSLTLGNRAGHAQAWPVLVLTLTDQRNRPLARRSFAPSEYLGDPRRIAAGMPPRSEQPLSLPLTVHDLKPMGFDLQLRY